MIWSLLQTVEIPVDADILKDWLSPIVGTMIVPFVGIIKKYFPGFTEYIKKFLPMDHWVAILSAVVALVYTYGSGLDLTINEVVNVSFGITGASNILYALVNKGKSPFKKMVGHKLGNE